MNRVTALFGRGAFFICLAMLAPRLWAADNEAAMQFKGVLNAPPACTINNNQRIDVNFGERVGVNKVDGENYRQTVNYEINCEPNQHGLALGLSLTAGPSSFDSAAVQTNIPDLAIRVLLAGQPFVLNKRVNIDSAAPPLLQAVPVKRPGSNLKANAFLATATLLADYQ
ncbi:MULTISPECIES: fimbrial protein [Serratia]|uniref:fimbrial protein n=1 Tax=Serratia TaxID=613 RepID=UPI0009361581|nr:MULTISPECIES: fimbrial protein [Serratia]OJT41044.1 hypothetical protein BSR04_12435 [Serratia plymuthica]CAI1080564.1 putative minor fimbrial subunit StfF [Serratia proteamaculans]CAI1131408.1 putative minor fimbrial subunit StfF [Serratia proteamaculans]CAI2145244.1 putative minor fimbrial subunit StfF [Serratia proteamaculans]